ncbi:MAG TPA: 16S rRNA pseudouridine(516) synthase [Spongiibacteraceae bacterium]|nr:16S rRNA pseudouridine(516) synthase [Spongiibacteraceae bacterium]HCS26772.1 16S rRNA pseudouridine(516) synthase [Spongiibacteraceae bacterium]|tara:strand:- start:1453 stop:2202 length:750 start_codon:yes stop_codon:yes gene_type:complete
MNSPSTRNGKPLRLDKYLSSVTDYSRSDAKKLIKNGELSVDGDVITNPGALVSADASLELNGQNLRQVQHRYFMLHKPQGYVCATRDRRHPTVIDLLDEDNQDALHIAGRLDIDTTGLVLITDDGPWAHQVMSPKRQCFKRYRVGTGLPLDDSLVERFEKGVFLSESKRRTLPASLSILDPHEALLEICEGKFHQVKRMFGAVGNEVVALHREAVGALELDSDLAEGEYRALTAAEALLAVTGTVQNGS